MPIGAESSFRGIIDLVTMKQHMYTNDNGTDIQVSEIDEQFKAKAEEMHLTMLEAVADYDDELMMKVLDGEEPSVEEVKAAIRKGVMTLNSSLLCAVPHIRTRAFSYY